MVKDRSNDKNDSYRTSRSIINLTGRLDSDLSNIDEIKKYSENYFRDGIAIVSIEKTSTHAAVSTAMGSAITTGGSSSSQVIYKYGYMNIKGELLTKIKYDSKYGFKGKACDVGFRIIVPTR